MELSVIIPLYNGERTIGPLLESLALQEAEAEWEVVISDNGSTDRGLEIVKDWGGRPPWPRIVDSSSESGAAHARNAGARAAHGAALLFIDHDDVAGAGYISAMAAALRSHDFVCARSEVEKLNPKWTWALRPSGQSEGPMMWIYDFLPYAAGGTMGIKRGLFEAVGGFDEAVDIADCCDLAWRVQLETGVELAFAPEAVLHYRYRHSLRGMFAQARGYGRAEVDMYSRYLDRGLKRIAVRRSLRRWARLIRRLPSLRHRPGQAWWITECGNMIGRLEGSVANRTILF